MLISQGRVSLSLGLPSPHLWMLPMAQLVIQVEVGHGLVNLLSCSLNTKRDGGESGDGDKLSVKLQGLCLPRNDQGP